MQTLLNLRRQVFVVNIVSFVLLVFCASMAEAAAPVITAGPVSQTVSTGQNATFSVSATGSLLRYQWMKGGSPISGATGSTLSLSNVQSTDAYPYSVSVSNSQGTVVSDLASLIVVNSNNPGGSSVFLSPQSKAVPQGTGVSWSVSYQASRYTWRKNGSTVRDDWQGGYWSGVWPTTTSTYSISSSTGTDSGDYDVVITVAGTGQQITSTTSKLFVNVSDFPTILTQPSGGYVGAGNPLNLSVYATGKSMLLYQWYKNGQAIAGANSSTYSVNVAETSDAGTYEVLVSNSLGSADSSQAIISVLERPQLLPSTKSVSQGGSASWSITASGVDRFTWRRNGSTVWSDYQYGGWSGVNASATSTYTINPALSTHAGTYDVVVHRFSENVDVVSTPSVLTVSVANEPYIVQQPSSTSSSIGSTVQFSVSATGAETLRYQWKRNGENIPNATSSTLTLSNIQSTDALKYTVVINNTYGTVTSSVATLTLESTSPGATLTPSTRSVPEGVQVSWNYSAYAGSVYTWRKNGVTVWQDNKGSGWSGVLGWTSSTYTIPSAQLSDTGDYDVVAVQPLSGGSSASSVSALTVVKLIKTAIDTDGDGVADDVETANGTDPNDPISLIAVNKGLIAYYPFDGNAKDGSGNGNDGTVNGATLAPDRFGKTDGAYSFAAVNGTLQNINLGNSSLFNFGNGDYSFVCWAKLDKDQIDRYILVKYAAFGGSGYGLGTTSGTQPYYFAKGSSDKWIGSGPSLNSGQWRQISITHRNGVTLSYYLDGQLLQSVSGDVGGAISNSAPLLVGGFNIDGQQFEGKVDDIRIYNRVLTAAEITQLYEDNNLDGVKDSKAISLGYDPTLNLRPLIDSLKKEPVEGLYNQTQYEASRASGRSDVTTSPNTYGLYTPTQIMDMNIGGITLQRNLSTGSYTLNYLLEQSTDLQSWTTYRTKTEELTGLPSDKAFIRIHTK